MTSLAYGALWIFVFSIPWERVIVVNNINVITRMTGMLAVGAALLAVVITGRMRRWHTFHVSALLFVLWCGFSLLAVRLRQLPDTYMTYVQLFLVLWIIWELAPSAQRQRGLLTAYVLGAYIAALNTVWLYRTQAGLLRRFAAAGADPNDLAMVLALALPMAWYLGTTYRRPILQWICRGYLPVGLVAIGLTGSRGGMLTSMVGLLVVPLTMTKLSPGRMASGIAMLVLAGALAVAYVPDTIVQRLATTRSEVEDASLGGRFKIWIAGMHAFGHKPLMGYGTGTFKNAVTPWLGYPKAAHNSFLAVLVEQGIVGFLLYMMMFLAVFLSLLKLPPMERRFGLVLLATLGVAMLPLSWHDRKVVWFVLAALLGLSQAHVVGRWRGVQQQQTGAVRAGGRRPPAPRRNEPLITPFQDSGPGTAR